MSNKNNNISEYFTYKADYPHEEFIRPLLAHHIQDLISKYALNLNIDNKSVLDVGCGKQPFRKLFEKYGFKYIGLDFRQNQENTVEIIEQIDTNFLYKYQDLQLFDFIICTEVLEHVAQWDTAFENLYALCKPTGRVLITCPQFYELHEEPYDFWRPTPYALEFYAKKVGFKVIENIKAGDAWDVLGTALGSMHSIYYAEKISLKYKLIFKLFNYTKKWLFKNLSNGSIQKNIKVNSSLYLSNVMVLER